MEKPLYKVGDTVIDLFYPPESARYRRMGNVTKVNYYLNESNQYCHLIKWDDEEEVSYHPKNLKKLTKLEKALK